MLARAIRSDDGREYVEAMLGLQVWSHSLYERMHGEAHLAHSPPLPRSN